MTHYGISHWTITEGKCGLLLFAQSLEELLAMHSHDSHKVPALNFHYICFEVLNTIELIEQDILDRGNLIPLFAEMRILFQEDWIAQKFLGSDFDSIFFTKNNKGEYEKRPIKIDSGKDVGGILPQIKKGIKFIIEELGRNNQYYLELKCEAKRIIIDSGEDLEKLDSLWTLTKIIASELINRGFNQSYIYDCIKQIFFDPEQQVDTIEAVERFFDNFLTDSRKYSVYFPINSIKQKKALDDYGVFKIEENVYELFDASISYILKYECDARDPYRAREDALNLINFCLSVNQFIKHNKYDYNPKYSEVFDQKSQKVTFIKKPEPSMVRGNIKAEEIDLNDLLHTCLGLNAGAIQILQLHSAAMTSKNMDNQLINLWTAVEVAVPVVRKDGLSRINQISNVFTAALSENYFLSLVHQLLLDVKSADESLIDKVANIELQGTLELKLLAILVLEKYSAIYDEINNALIQTVPLLACRMHRYQNKWSSTESLKKVYRTHVDRLSQQIMRIYRTRNMLVHDGSYLPYADYVLQNLHYYVDSFVRFLCNYYKAGYRSIQTIVDAALFNESLYLRSLSENQMIGENDMVKYFFRKKSVVRISIINDNSSLREREGAN